MRRSQKISTGTAALSVALVLGACSGGAAGSPSGTAGAGDITLTLTDTMSQTSQLIYDPIYQACADSLGVKIEPNHVAGSGLIQSVLQQISSRTLPDVLMLDNPDVQQIAASGALSTLTDYGISTDGFPQAIVDAGTYDGKLYGIAPVVNAVGLIYNVDLLKAANVTPPTTWDELKAAASTLTTSDRYGLAFSAVASGEGTSQFLPFLWSNGGKENDLTSSQAVGALQFLTDLVKDGSVSQSVVNWSQNDVNDQFIAGKAAMEINGPWNMPKLEAAQGLNYAVTEVPVPKAGDTLVASLGGEAFTVPLNSDTARMQIAGKFVKCITSDDNQLTMATGRGGIPASSAVAQKAAEEKPLISAFVDTISSARARTALLGKDFPAASTKIYTAEQLALTGQASPADALAQASAG